MIDIHAHILPNVDDGSDSFAMSKLMIDRSIEEGVEAIAATPHLIQGLYEPGVWAYYDGVQKLQEMYEGRISIIPSMEIMYDSHFMELFHADRFKGYHGGKVLLVEYPLGDYPLASERDFHRLIKEGHRIILAHPERNRALKEDPEKLYHLFNLGVFFQLNAGSLKGHFGESTRVFAERLVEHNLVHALGSDAHNDRMRDTRIAFAFDRVEALNPGLHRWILEYTAALIEGAPVKPLAPAKWTLDHRNRRGGLLGLFRKK